MDDFEFDYEKLLIENESMYDNLGDFNIPSLEYLIYICEIIIESKQWNEGYFWWNILIRLSFGFT